MKNLFIFLLGVAAVLSIKVGQPIPAKFPPQFTAYYNETDWATWYYPSGMKTLYYDEPNRRAHEVVTNRNKQLEDYYLYFQPPGAEPGSPSAQGYTKLVVNPDYPAYVPNNCYYQTTRDSDSTPFANVWWSTSPDRAFEVNGFPFSYPNDLVYSGVAFIEELGVFADRWDSSSRCNLQQSGIGNVPCTSIFQSRDDNQYPLKDISAYGARPHSFESDVYLVRVYHSFKPTVSDSDFAWPQKWPVTCGYADSGFVFNEYTLIYAYSTNANFTFKLKAPPVQGLGGQVKVSFSLNPTWYYNCTNCVGLSQQVLQFDMNNWNTTQVVHLDYISSGCEQLQIKASGGGYDWQYESTYNHLILEACTFDPATGFCKEHPVCGG